MVVVGPGWVVVGEDGAAVVVVVWPGVKIVVVVVAPGAVVVVVVAPGTVVVVVVTAVVVVVVDGGEVVDVVEVDEVVDDVVVLVGGGGGGAAQRMPPAGTWAWDSMCPIRMSARWLVGSGTRSLMRTTSTAAAARVPSPAALGGPGLAVSSPIALGSSPMLIEPNADRSMCVGIAEGPKSCWVVRMICVGEPGGVMLISGVVGLGLPAGA